MRKWFRIHQMSHWTITYLINLLTIFSISTSNDYCFYFYCSWTGQGSEPLDTFVEDWLNLGVRYIGGCCRTYAKDVTQIKKKVLEWQKNHWMCIYRQYVSPRLFFIIKMFFFCVWIFLSMYNVHTYLYWLLLTYLWLKKTRANHNA